MSKPILFLLFLQLICFMAFSQEKSLKALMAEKNSSAKVDELHAYAQNLLDVDNKQAGEIYKKTVAISQALGYDLGLATAYRKTGYIHGQDGNYREAINHFRTAVKYYSSGGGHIKDLLVCYNNLGANFHQIGQVDSTIHYYLAAIQQAEAWPLDKEDPTVKQDILSTLSLLHANVSSMYGNQFNVPKALEYGTKSMTIAREIKDTLRIILSALSTIHGFSVNKEFEKALVLAREAAVLSDLYGLPVARAKAYHVLSVNYTKLNKLDSGINAARVAIKYARETDRQLYISALLDLSDAYHDKRAYKEEAALLQDALKEFKEVDNVAFGMNMYEKLADAKYALGQYKEAYDYYLTSASYKDSMLSKQNRDKIADLEMQYQVTEKEKTLSNQQLQLTQKNLQLQQSKQYFMYSIGIALLTFLALAFIYFNYQNKRKLHQRQLKSVRQEKEIQLLQALMHGEEKERSRIAKDLHDGVAGTLAAVKMNFSSLALQQPKLSDAKEYRQGVKLLDEASVEVRKTSHNLMPEVLIKYGLDEALRRYCSNLTNSILFIQYDSWGDIVRYKDSFELSVYRIMQELLNNIIKHSKANNAIVQLSVQDKILSLTIEDNGVGYGEDMAKEGMGIHSLQTRVKAMNGKIEMNSGEGNGVCAYLEFDLVGLEEPEFLETA